jgi:predicted ATPase
MFPRRFFREVDVKLTSFRIVNYRSINDSGEVKTGRITTLVGRNESGKTNLLLALHALNPAGGRKDLSPIKDFPRHRRLSECTNDTEVIHTTWELLSEEQVRLTNVFPRAKGVKHIAIRRYYKAPDVSVEFLHLRPIEFSHDDVTAMIGNITAAVRTATERLEEAPRQQLRSAAETLEKEVAAYAEPNAWADVAASALAQFRQTIASSEIDIEPREEGLLTQLENLAASISKDRTALSEARKWIAGIVPLFIYIADYPELTGHQNIAEYLKRRDTNPNQLTEADRNFEKMCKVAELDPQQLNQLLAANDHETRNQLTNRSGAIVTAELRRLWRDRELKVRFSPDANHLDTFVSDPNTTYDVEVNLDERSRGLKWFFSFYITFSADTKGGPAEKAILLLDEPGIHLHAAGQGDLLRHLSADFQNQIIYTTHSPFMVPTENLDSIRTVNIHQDSGTTVTNEPTGDAMTLFPIQSALGFYLSQSLFVGPTNLVVEGVTDFWIISSISAYLESVKKECLPKQLTLTPAGGAQKVPYMVALLTSERLNVLVLLDDERQARGTRDELVKAKLIRDDNVVFVTDSFIANKPTEADIEDLLDPHVYEMLVQESYKDELKTKKLTINENIPRIVKRYTDAFSLAGLEFHKTRPARLLLHKMASEPQIVVTETTSERFEGLFKIIGEHLNKLLSRPVVPFQ